MVRQSLQELLALLLKRNSEAAAVLHEITHLAWVGATNPFVNAYVNGQVQRVQQPNEVYGWFQAAQYAANQPNFNDNTYLMNADSYAWYAECK